jgi:uncharacterized membrane-anchored protein YitT (DUF2179 family)
MKQILKRVVETLIVIFGNCIYAFGIAMFILPSGLITGGTTGIALFVNDVFHTPVTVFVLVFNTIMFLIGFFAFGWKFAANTVVSTFSYPIALELITRLLGGYRITDDLIRYLYRGSDRTCHQNGSFHRRYGYPAFDLK